MGAQFPVLCAHWFIAKEPAPIVCLLPTCRDYVVSDIEPIFNVPLTRKDKKLLDKRVARHTRSER